MTTVRVLGGTETVTGEHDKERRRAIELLEEHGWTADSITGKGYTKLLCGCGVHTRFIPKTPSGPNTFRRKAADFVKLCSTKDATDEQ